LSRFKIKEDKGRDPFGLLACNFLFYGLNVADADMCSAIIVDFANGAVKLIANVSFRVTSIDQLLTIGTTLELFANC